MAEQHSKAERRRLKNMLSDAIRVLCQNTVRYDVELSIEALIGITVDGGKDILIVSLNELVGKHAADTTFGKDQYYSVANEAQNTDAQAEYVDDEIDEYLDTEDADQEYDNNGEPCMPYGTMVKEELMSTITYGNVGENHFQPTPASAMGRYKAEPYTDGTDEYYEEPMYPPNVGFKQGWPTAARPSATVASKSQTAGFGGQKRTKLASPDAKKYGRFGSKVSADGGKQQKSAAVGKTQPLNGEDAVSQFTLYTCGMCGAQMQHYASFMRHKRSHTGQQLYRCEGCGKMIRRHDNLLTHQRRCPAYLSQLQHSDPGL